MAPGYLFLPRCLAGHGCCSGSSLFLEQTTPCASSPGIASGRLAALMPFNWLLVWQSLRQAWAIGRTEPLHAFGQAPPPVRWSTCSSGHIVWNEVNMTCCYLPAPLSPTCYQCTPPRLFTHLHIPAVMHRACVSYCISDAGCYDIVWYSAVGPAGHQGPTSASRVPCRSEWA